MAITFNEIAELVARFGNSVVTEQANLAAPFVGKGVIQKQNHTGTVGIVNVKAGGMLSTGFLADGQKLPDGSNVQPQQLAYHPKALFSRLSIPRIAALTAISKQDGVNLVKEQMESVGADLGRTLGRAVFASGSLFNVFAAGLTPINGVASPQVDSLTGLDLSGYRIGATFIGPVDDLGPIAVALKVVALDYTVGQVTFEVYDYDAATGTVGDLYDNTVPGNINGVVTTDIKPLDGGNVIGAGQDLIANMGNTITSLLDLAGETVAPTIGSLGAPGNYAGISATATPEFHGNEVNVAGALTIEKMDELSKDVKRRSGQPWTHTVLNSTNLHNYMSLLISERRFVGGNQAADASVGSMATFEGKPVVVDENMPDSQILLFTQSDAKLAQWRDFQPDYDGSKAAMVSDSSFIYDTQIFGMYNIRCTKRSGLGKLINITGGSW